MQEIFVTQESSHWVAKRNGLARTGATEQIAIENLRIAEGERLENDKFEKMRQSLKALRKKWK
jgi:hypothetical protein